MGNVYNTPPEQPYDNGVGAGVIVGVILAIVVVLALLWILFAHPFNTTTTSPAQPNSGQTINVNNPPSGSNSAQPTAVPTGSNTGSNTGNNSQPVPVIGTNPQSGSSSNSGSNAQPTPVPTSSGG